MTLARLLADITCETSQTNYSLWLMSCLVLLFVLHSTQIDSPWHVAEMHTVPQ